MSGTALATLWLPYSTLAEWIAGTWMSPGIEIKGGVDGPKELMEG